MKKYSADRKYLVMSREEVRAVDLWAIETVGVPGVVLMENAGRSCAGLIEEKLADADKAKVCIFCGTGNNGGDGYVIARHLLNSGFEVTVVICGQRGRIKGDARVNLDILERLGQPIEVLDIAAGDIRSRVGNLTKGADMLVDAVFGTGLSGQLNRGYKELINSINGLGIAILAVDIPSGLDCDTGEPLGEVIRASCTVTFVAVKRGFMMGRASEYTGEIYIASIGVEPADDVSG